MKYFLFGGAGILVMAALLCFTKPSSPAGRYVPCYGTADFGDSYYEFANGQGSIVVNKPSTNGGTVPFCVKGGVYFQTNGAWVYLSDRDNAEPLYLKNSWFGVSVSYANGPRYFWRRRSIPSWLMDWLPWGFR